MTSPRGRDLRRGTAKDLRAAFERLLERVVSTDTTSTRREQQLNQLCNLVLVKLDSDRRALESPGDAVAFAREATAIETARRVAALFRDLAEKHRALFASREDAELALDPSTIHDAVATLERVQLVDAPLEAMSAALQVLRSEHLKADEGQYFTPSPVARSAMCLLGVAETDRIVDPACGTGGFLVEAHRRFRELHPELDDSAVSRWARDSLFGVDKDSINVKLARAVLLAASGSGEHVLRGDSLRLGPSVEGQLADGAFTCVVTNPPFGKNLRLPAADARSAGFTISKKPPAAGQDRERPDLEPHVDRELGLAFLDRSHRLLTPGGRLGIVLPETYFFSASYRWLPDWLDDRFVLRGMFNVPMEAFQGFCRAKTNFYVLEKT